MRMLDEYPRPSEDTGWGFHDSAGADARPRDPRGFARYLREELGITWYKLLARGTNKVDMARALREAGIEVVVRLYVPQPHPRHVVAGAEVRAYVDAGVHYVEWGNEPNLSIEWDRASWDEGARVDKVCEQFLRNAEVIRAAGGIPLLPALSPGGEYPHRDWYRTMFEWFRLQGHLSDLEGAAVAIHNRPLAPWTEREYEWIDDLVRAYLGRSLPLLGTEAGWEPGWPGAGTLQDHAARNVGWLVGAREGRWRDALFCECMWLVDGFGHLPFSGTAWHNNPLAGGRNLPAVDLLRAEWAARPFTRRLAGRQGGIPAAVTAPGVTYRTAPRASEMFQSGRAAAFAGSPLWLVVHSTEGPRDAAFAWWCSPSNPGRSSAHDLVDRQGVVWRCVPYDRAAHHCGGETARIRGVPAGRTNGTSNTNHVSVGVELESDPSPMEPGYTTAQLRAAALHLRALVAALGIPRERVLRHLDVDPQRRDPRGLAWEELLDEVFQVRQGPDEQALGEWLQQFVVPQNREAALYKYGRARGWEPISPERDWNGYRAQVWYSPGDGRQHVVWARIGDWGNVRHFDR